MVTLVWRSDVHLAEEPPVSRVDDWASALLGKLTQVGDMARNWGASAVLDGGDLFHIKSPSRTTHGLMQRVAEVHREYPCPTLGNVGNHDVKFSSLRYLSESPLGVLFQSGVIKPCFDETEAFFGPVDATSLDVQMYYPGYFEGDPFLIVNPRVPVVRVVGIPYHGTVYELDRFTSIKKGREDYLICMVHCLASPQGGSMFEGEDIIPYRFLAGLEPDVFCFGHWHKDQGITEIAPKKWVVNVGSLSRGSIAQDDMDRNPSCVLLQFEKGKVDLRKVSLTVAPPSDIFDLVKVVRQEAQKSTVDTLVTSLMSVFTMQKGGSLLEDVREMKDIPEQVRERSAGYLERAGAK